MREYYDVLVVGSGIAGLSFALKIAHEFPHLKIGMITKASEDETNTKYAQGGVAAVTDMLEDSYEKHVRDTLVAGDGMCDEDIVNMVVREGPGRVRELITWGVNFDREEGEFHLGREGGHSENRIIHSRDYTGKEIERALLALAYRLDNLELLTHHFAVDLITGENQCKGLLVFDQEPGKIEPVFSKVTFLATGGAGQVYEVTTNPLIATGDGIAMAYRAGGAIKHMEFIQFHPTALYRRGENPAFLISEAVRGFGAILRNKTGKAFMSGYDKRASLAPRDVVARAILQEMKKNGEDHVYLDLRHLEQQKFAGLFPTIYKKCRACGFDPADKMIPVVPAAHYVCGGIEVNDRGQTNIPFLYACGECAYTGLHGANRLASNSLLEALVFSHRSFLDVKKKLESGKIQNPSREVGNLDYNTRDKHSGIAINRNKIKVKKLMSRFGGIVRNDRELEFALNKLNGIKQKIEAQYRERYFSLPLWELRNIVTVAMLILEAAKDRKENRGLHYKEE